MKKLVLLAILTLIIMGCEKNDINETAIVYDIEGKWLFASNLSNTMYIFEDGIRYTYYCVEGDCLSQYEAFEAADGNHIPVTNDYTFKDGTLTVDLNFGNELVAPITFECDGGKAYVALSNPFYLYRLNSNCN